MSSAPRPCTAAGNRGKPRSGCLKPLSQLWGRGWCSGEKQPAAFLRPLLPRAPWPPLVPVVPGQASPCSLASASPGPRPGPAQLPGPRGQGAARQPWARPGEAAGPGRAAPAPEVGVGRQLGPSSQPKSPAPPWSGPQLEGGLPTCFLFHINPRAHTQAEPSSAAPAPTSQVRTPTPDWGHCRPPPGGDRGRQASGHSGLGGAVLCSQDAHPLWSRQAALHQGGRKLERDPETAPLLPQRGLRKRRQSRAAFICLLLAASLLTSSRACLLANRTQTA